MEQTTFTITELSREFEVTPRTIRYYEDQGLLSPRREGQQRVYAKRDRTRLKLALRGKRLGLSLADIKQTDRHVRHRPRRGHAADQVPRRAGRTQGRPATAAARTSPNCWPKSTASNASAANC